MLLALLQVLRHLPKRFSTEVFCKLIARSGSLFRGLKYALHLPQDLLSRQVASTPAELDLRDAELTALQWTRLFSALSQEGAHLTTIHIRVMGIPVAASEIRVSDIDHLVRMGRDIQDSLKSPVVQPDGYDASRLSNTLDSLQSLITSGERDRKHARESECAHVLNTLEGLLPQMTSLTHLGLHHLQPHALLMPLLGQVLMNLPPSVNALTLTTAASPNFGVGRLQRNMLFNAIAMVRSLRELHMPDWENVVGNDGTCLESLIQMPHLEAVYVSKIGQSSAFPEWLGFKEITKSMKRPQRR
jgi:hypothetical protein